MTGVAVLGLGNVLMGDDGAGAAALAELDRRYHVPPPVALLDGGVLGLHLVGLLADVESLLVLDAVRSGREPGALVRLEGPQVGAGYGARMSPHEVGFAEVLATALVRGRGPRHLVVWGVEPASIRPAAELGQEVGDALGGLVDAAAGELRSWGLAVRPRPRPAPGRPYPEAVLRGPAARGQG